MAIGLQAKTLPASAGWQWIREGFALFRRNPPLITAMALSYVVVALALSYSGVIGPLVGALVLPSFSVVVFNAVRIVDFRLKLNGDELAAGIRRNGRTLVYLGLTQLAITQLVTLIVHMTMGLPGEAAPPEDVATWSSSQLKLLPLVLPWVLLMWFPPYLIAVFDLGLGKAIFFGLIGVLRNLLPFAVFAAAGLALMMLITTALTLTLGAIGLPAEVAMSAMFMMVFFVCVPTVAAATYLSFRTVFQRGENATDGDGAPA
ncbi:BPSS1780 family membrane protein [Methyloversatilis thermotolerans]|uniref:BPSS1780 family membrane protein n=1 Tax=Methyloversatilis thermotolerans TaxID=1346290 RepID=UPI00037104EF|nr:BPSS1780 family membrane protein [Methyloversatilis thermotolerans]